VEISILESWREEIIVERNEKGRKGRGGRRGIDPDRC
jgi:hypothetical protein